MLWSLHLSSRLQFTRRCILIARRWKSDAVGPTEDEIVACRQWMTKFTPDTIPNRLYDISYSRSSGPGGQNVNKVSSKATLRISFGELLPLLPTLLHQGLRQSRYYAPNSDSIVIQADDSRKQADNSHACIKKLKSLIFAAAEDAVPRETSEDQAKRVRGLQKRDNESRIKTKKIQSSKKASRRKGGWE